MDVVELQPHTLESTPDSPEGEQQIDLNIYERNQGHQLFEAIADLRRLGLNYGDMLEQSQCDKDFLFGLFNHLKLPHKISKRQHVPRTFSEPFYSNDYLQDCVISITDDDFSDSDDFKNEDKNKEDHLIDSNNVYLKQKEEEIRKMKLYIEELQRSKMKKQEFNTKNEDLIKMDDLKNSIEFKRKTLNTSNNYCLNLNKSIKELSKKLSFEQKQLEVELTQIEKLEESMSLDMTELQSLENKIKLEKEEFELNIINTGSVESSSSAITAKEVIPLNSLQDNNTIEIEEEEEEEDIEMEDVGKSLTDRDYSDDVERSTNPSSNILNGNNISMIKPETFEEYESSLKGLRSFKFHPNFDLDKLKSTTFTNFINPDIEFCSLELSVGVCSNEDCKYQHFKDIKLTENEIVMELTKDLPADNPSDYKIKLNKLSNLLLNSMDSDLAGLYNIIKKFRMEYLHKGEFLNFTTCGKQHTNE